MKRYEILAELMSRKEAIEILENEMKKHVSSEVNLHIAIRMAIEALTAQDKTDGDTISRTDAVEAVAYEIDDGYNAIVDRINALPSAEAGWIPCSEGLPKKGEVVLITNGKGNVRCGQYRSEHDVRGETHYWWWKGKTVETVIAWMPLPKPYKGGDSE